MYIDNEPCFGHSSTSQTEEDVVRIRQAILEDPHWTVDELADLTGVSWNSCQQILCDNSA